MKNSIFVILLTITCTFSLNLKGDHGGNDDCLKDGPHPTYFTIQEMLKFKSDEKFKTTIQGFMNYFHAACHDYQSGYVRGRISEMIKLTPTENQAFFKRFVKNGFSPKQIDPRISSSIQHIMTTTIAKISKEAHTDCSKDGTAPRYISYQRLSALPKRRFRRRHGKFIEYFNKACHAYQVGYVMERISELLKMCECTTGEFLKKMKKYGNKKNIDIDIKIWETYSEIMEITAQKIEH